MKREFKVGDAVVVMTSYLNPGWQIGLGDILQVTEIRPEYLTIIGYCSMCDKIHTEKDDFTILKSSVELLESIENLQ